MIDLDLPESKIINLKKKEVIPEYGGVYAFYSKEGYLIYVGKATSFRRRMNYHLSDGYKKFIQRMEVFRIDEETDREIYETYLINKWKPLFNIRKTITYQSLANHLKQFDTFDSVQEIIDNHPNHNLIKFTKRISPEPDNDLDISGLCKVTEKILDGELFLEKSQLREELAKHGYNVNEIMTKSEFSDLLINNGFDVSKRHVKQRIIAKEVN